MQHRPLPLEIFPDQIRRSVDPGSPSPMRMMAARGLVPAAPPDMATMLYQLSLDQDSAIAQAARQTLSEAPDQIVIAAASAPLAPPVLDLIADLHATSDLALEAIFYNDNTVDETFVRLARKVSESLTELIATNQVRMIRTPAIIESLYLNPNARMSTIDRILDFAARSGVRFQLPALRNLVEDPGYDTAAVAEESAHKATTSGGDDLFRELLRQSMEGDEEDWEDEDDWDLDDERAKEAEESEVQTTNISSKILAMTVSERVRLAMLGSVAERDYLIKDNNRLVNMAAATSPKVQIKDVVGWSGNRLIPETVLSYIANHRRFRRIYQVQTNLVNNPKTPLKDGLRLLPVLVDRDLRALLRNRNVPHQLRRQAKSILETKAKGKRG